MNDGTRTLGLGMIAGVLLILALVTTPKTASPEMYSAEGEEFYPEFTDPLTVTSVEISTFNAGKRKTKSIKVENQGGTWRIPSHYNHPADAEDRIKKTTFALVGLKKDLLHSNREEDHARLEVLDPSDSSLKNKDGFGKRVTLRDTAGNTVADYIVGKKVPKRDPKKIPYQVKKLDPKTGKEEEREMSLTLTMRYVRIPGKKHTYGAWTSAEISHRFSDWIRTDLLKLDKDNVQELAPNPYQIKEYIRLLKDPDGNVIFRMRSKPSRVLNWNPFPIHRNREGKWEIGESEVPQARVDEMLTTLKPLSIINVRPRQTNGPPAETLGFMNLPIEPETKKSLVSKAGEFKISMKDGIVYTLWFGNILFGERDGIADGKKTENAESDETGKDDEKEEKKPESGKEHRYVFLTARFDSSLVPLPSPLAPPPLKDLQENNPLLDFDARRAIRGERARKLEEWKKENDAAMEKQNKERQEKISRGKQRVEKMNNRFENWYYVISGDSFKKLHKTREDLLKK